MPHAHAQGTGYRLDAWTGDIYPAGSERKRTIGKLSKKELARLHSDPGFLKLATIKQEEVADVFAFVGKSHVKSEM